MSSRAPLVSVVIPTRNRASLVASAVRSVLDQTHPKIELLVVDDGSEDRTPDVLAELSARYGIQVIGLDVSGGAGRARNLGVERARGELVAFLDDDCRWHPTKLERQVRELDAEHGVVYCRQAVRSADDSEWIVEGRPPPASGIRKALLRANCIGTSTILTRRTLFLEAGGFDEQIPRLQDWELLLRLVRRTEFGYVGEVLVTGEMVAGGISTDRAGLATSARRIAANHEAHLSPGEAGELLYGLGKYLLADGLTRESRTFFIESLRRAPTRPIGLLGLAASLLGPKFARTVRSWRRRLVARRAAVGPAGPAGPHAPQSSESQ